MFISLPLNHPMTFLKLGSLSMMDARPEAPPLPPIIMLRFILADNQIPSTLRVFESCTLQPVNEKMLVL